MSARFRSPEYELPLLGISIRAAQQLLYLAGAITSRPGHLRRQAVVTFKAGQTAQEMREELRLHGVTLKLAIADYAAELAHGAPTPGKGPKP